MYARRVGSGLVQERPHRGPGVAARVIENTTICTAVIYGHSETERPANSDTPQPSLTHATAAAPVAVLGDVYIHRFGGNGGGAQRL